MSVQKEKYLTFIVGDEVYGLPVIKAKEIIGMTNITYVPEMPVYIKGIINLRGKIIPAIDLRLKFGLNSRTYDDKTCIIIVEIKKDEEKYLNGLIVDTVSEVLDINQNDIELPLIYGNNTNNVLISGIGKVRDKIIIILDTNKIIVQQDADKVITLCK